MKKEIRTQERARNALCRRSAFGCMHALVVFALMLPSTGVQATDASAARASAAAQVIRQAISSGSGQQAPRGQTGTGVGDPSSFDPANYFENKELIRAPRAIQALDANLFGDRVNLYRGGLEFVQTDVSLEGSSKLPVAVTRKLSAGGPGNLAGGLFSEWDLEIPHMHGTFLSGAGWVTGLSGGLSTNQRCSNFGAPPSVASAPNVPGWRAYEFWGGNMLTVPGAGTQEVLRRSASNNNIPSDGQATPLVTVGNWAIRCLSSLASANASTPSAEQGEGFLAIAPDGTKYRFDWLVSRPAKSMSKQSSASGSSVSVTRSEVWMLAPI